MNSVGQALQLMAIGLPLMFTVIVLFILLVVLLKKIFPNKGEE